MKKIIACIVWFPLGILFYLIIMGIVILSEWINNKKNIQSRKTAKDILFLRIV